VALVPGHGAADGTRDWLGSSGKTQSAVYFAETLWRSRQVDMLAWVTATSRESVLSGYVQAAAAMGASPSGDAESVAATLVGWLAETSRPWLVVLDDLRDLADLEGLWPAGPAGRLLITTADSATISGEYQALPLPVPVFSSREAMQYLTGRLTTDPDHRSGAIDLVGDLGCEPIALTQASAVIASAGLPCRDYRHYFTQRQDQVVAPGNADQPAAAVTWTLSAEYAEQLSPGMATRLLALAALLDGHGIPGAVFTTSAACEYLTSDAAGRSPDPKQAWTALLSLRQAGLLAVDQAGTPPTVRISPVIQAAVRAVMPDGMVERAARKAADALAEVWPQDNPQSVLATDLRSCAASLMRTAGDLLWAGGRGHPLLWLAGQSMDSARLTGPAVGYWRALAADSDRVLGSGSPETLMASGHLAEALLAAGQAAEAVSWFQWTLNGRVSQLGPDHPATITAKVLLGRALVAAGQPEDALTVLNEAVADSDHSRGADHIDTIATLEEFAAACRDTGKTADAIRSYQRALAGRERVQGPQHPDTVTTSLRLAEAYLAGGKTKDAISQYKRVLADRERAFGPDHLETLLARCSLASAYTATGRMGSALPLFEEACAGYERALGANHPETLARKADLARAYFAAGRLGDATAVLTDAVARSEEALSPGDPLAKAMRETLAELTGG
jgi:tetratricopeptide (TPR) repeat protein